MTFLRWFENTKQSCVEASSLLLLLLLLLLLSLFLLLLLLLSLLCATNKKMRKEIGPLTKLEYSFEKFNTALAMLRKLGMLQN